MDLVALVVPTLPGFFWLFIFYRTDRYQPEPKGLVIQTFLLGIASLVPTIALYEVARGHPAGRRRRCAGRAAGGWRDAAR